VSDERYDVANSLEVGQQLRAAVEVARAHGEFAVAVRASRWILEELARNPAAFGESRNYFDAAKLYVRIGFAGPVYVVYGIHEPSRTVFVRKIGYSVRKR
jgi:hypothetical protein